MAAFACDERLPEWFVSVRPATPAEDQAGVDVWVSTTRGDVAVQVKSSGARARLFRERHPGMEVAVVVLHASMAAGKMRGRVLAGVYEVWVGREERKAA